MGIFKITRTETVEHEFLIEAVDIQDAESMAMNRWNAGAQHSAKCVFQDSTFHVVEVEAESEG